MRRVAFIGVAFLTVGFLASCGDDSATGTKMESGEGFLIAYASPGGVGIDNRNAVTATFTDGVLDKYVWTGDVAESPARGTMTESETSSDGKVGIGRWNNGASGGNDFYGNTITLTADEGFHFAIGKPSPAGALTALINYNPIAATKLTVDGGGNTPGEITAEGLVLDYPSSQMAIRATITSGGETFTLATGALTSPVAVDSNLDGMLRINSVPVSSATVCPNPGDCTAVVVGFASGDGAESAGVAFLVSAPGGGQAAGAARFTK